MKFFLVLLALLLLAGCGTSKPAMHTHHVIGWPLVVQSATTLSPAQVCATRHVECARYLLGIINGHRAAAGLPRYALDWHLTNNTTTCRGATAHAWGMLRSGTIWHTNPAYPANSFPQDFCEPWTSIGQNVGFAQSGDESQAIATIDGSMMAEGSSGGHFQNLMSRTFTRIGFGFARSGQDVYLVEDFTQ